MRRKVTRVLVGLIPVVIVIGLVCYGQAAAQGDQYHACASRAGYVRLVGDVAECRNSETPMQWNKAGSKGFYWNNLAHTITGEGGYSVRASCDDGDVLTGGGYRLLPVPGFGTYNFFTNGPVADGSAEWEVYLDVSNLQGGSINLTLDVYAVCADVTP